MATYAESTVQDVIKVLSVLDELPNRWLTFRITEDRTFQKAVYWVTHSEESPKPEFHGRTYVLDWATREGGWARSVNTPALRATDGGRFARIRFRKQHSRSS